MNVIQALKSINAYPIPCAVVEAAALECGLDPRSEASTRVVASKEYKRTKAQLYIYLSTAPNVSQGGISFSFSGSEKAQFLKLAKALLAEIGDDASKTGGVFGYKGEDF